MPSLNIVSAATYMRRVKLTSNRDSDRVKAGIGNGLEIRKTYPGIPVGFEDAWSRVGVVGR